MIYHIKHGHLGILLLHITYLPASCGGKRSLEAESALSSILTASPRWRLQQIRPARVPLPIVTTVSLTAHHLDCQFEIKSRQQSNVARVHARSEAAAALTTSTPVAHQAHLERLPLQATCSLFPPTSHSRPSTNDLLTQSSYLLNDLGNQRHQRPARPARSMSCGLCRPPVQQYEYKPLDKSTDEIRLLRPEHGNHSLWLSSRKLRFTVQTVQLVREDTAPSYYAISYAWQTAFGPARSISMVLR